MKRYRELFEKYKVNDLDSNRMEEMNQLLVEAYFHSASELSGDELLYAEDLVIELITTDKLDEKFVFLFESNLNTNKLLARKYSLLRNLGISHEASKHIQPALLTDQKNAEAEEEEQLSRVLQEVIEKVNAEKAAGELNFKTANAVTKIKAFFAKLVPSFIPDQPQLRAAMAFASVILIAVIVWITVTPDKNNLISVRNDPDTVQNIPAIKNDSTLIKSNDIPAPPQKPEIASVDSRKDNSSTQEQTAAKQNAGSLQDSAAKALDMTLLAYADDIPAGIEYLELRSASTDAQDLFIAAAGKYETKEYDTCARILKSLLKSNAFSSPDTFSEINYYLGVIYMTKGFRKANSKMLNLALQAFGKVHPASVYYDDSRWYSALIEIKTGRKTKGKSILDSLLNSTFIKADKVKKLMETLDAQNYK